MYIDTDEFKKLKTEQYADLGGGEILFRDNSIPDEEKEKLRVEYKKWWEKKQERKLRSEFN